MTVKEAMKRALEALETECDIYREHDEDGAPEYILDAITALKERLLPDPMREVQRLGQEIEQEPICPACKAKVLYECVACSSNNYPQKENT